MTNELQIPDEVLKHPAWYRLQDQRDWYSKESAKNKKRYHQLKITQIVLAGSIPIITLIDFPSTKYTVFISFPERSIQRLQLFRRPASK